MTDEAMAVDIAFHGGPEKIAELAAEVERRGGVRGLFVAEAAHDPYVALALAAVATHRIEIGTSIAVAFARTPMATAYSAYDLHRLSGGRLVLGLGTQIKPHITRRYGMPWSAPAARMTEYVAALRAIWESWQTGDRLDFRGDFYEHTLMTPMFSPGQLDLPSPRVWLAAVGPRMLEAAGAVGDGLICHPLLSRSYLADALHPALAAGRAAGGSDRPFTTAAMAMVTTGRTEEAYTAAIAGTKRQIGFYASTPAYKPVLDHHGWGDLHAEAHAMTKQGRWDELGDLVDDEMLTTLAVVGELDQVGNAMRERFGGLADRVILSIPYAADDMLGLDIVSG